MSMSANTILREYLENHEAINYFGENAPNTIDLGVGATFRRIDFMSKCNSEESHMVYQSDILNKRGEYPIFEIVVKAKHYKRKTAYNYVWGFLGTHVW